MGALPTACVIARTGRDDGEPLESVALEGNRGDMYAGTVTHQRRRRRIGGAAAAAALALGAAWVAPGASGVSAIEPEPAEIVDDFEDGDTSDWGFFGGVNAGGGGGPATDRPAQGGTYFSTGWGGEGTDSGFYGGTFKNLPNDAQVAVPADAQLNMWLLTQSDTTVDAFTVEITLREDTDGDGWTDGSEDSVRYDLEVPPSDWDDQWRFVSIPLGDFADAGTGGNGAFDTALDEIVLVIAGVEGGSSSVVEIDVDDISLTEGGPVADDVIDDFENGLPNGAAEPNGEPLGFYTFNGAGSGIAISPEATPPAPVLDAIGEPNNVLRMNIDSSSFAGYIHAFENDAVDTWVTQDWSTREGISFWFNGTGSGAGMFLDILDNRSADSTTDDAERWTVAFTDDSDDWVLYEFPFTSFTRKEIGNGAPNDGLGLFAMHGYAIGALGTNGPQTFYFDQLAVYGEAEPPALAAQFSINNTFIPEGTTGEVAVKLNRPMGPDDPAQVSIDFQTEVANAVPGEDYTPTGGTLTFVNGGANELTFPVETFDDSKFTGDLRVVVRLTNPVDVERGALFQGSVLIEDDDPFDPDLRDDFEQGSENQWSATGPVELDGVRTEGATERPGQDTVENALAVTVTDAGIDLTGTVERAISDLEALLPTASSGDTTRFGYAIARLEAAIDDDVIEDGWITASTGDDFIGRLAQAVSPLLRAQEFGRPEAIQAQAVIDDLVDLSRMLGTDAVAAATDEGGDADLIDAANDALGVAEDRLESGLADVAIRNFRKAWKDAVAASPAAVGGAAETATLERDFPLGQDWTGTESVDFWFEGSGSGEPVTFTLKDNRAPDPGPAGWNMVWSDEFDGEAGAPPNPANWTYELGDVTPDGKNGWGNEELQYYTDDPDNSATDGEGNLVITLGEADEGRECYYGPCEFESARLITQHKAEFAYGRIESRLQVPTGGDGLWPAFWSLGTDITYNPWPGAGEIDFMEYVSRLPNEIFGTIHGPGYAGGNSFSGIWDFGERVDNEYHTFTTEWEPGLITWYVDGIKYHEARPSDVDPNPWVFEKPFFLLLNFAIGGNFGGTPDPANTYPQEYLVDYVRVYQGPDSAERFETTFVDDVDGWQKVSIPLSELERSATQPENAPDDGLGINEVWGYELTLPAVETTFLLDDIRSTPTPPPSELVVTTTADAGPGSLRDALATIGPDGTITFDPALEGSTIALTSGQLDVDTSVTVDASATPVTISAGDLSRVIEVAPGADVTIRSIEIRDGAAGPQGGGILNNGALTLDSVVVADNAETSAGPANFQFGGGGIYNGQDATLDLIDSTVRDNISLNQPGGGIFGFFGSTVNIIRSTVSGNSGGDVAGGLRSLGDVNVDSSTFSGNISTAWHGGGIFHTDGVLTVSNSTFAENVAPPGTASGILVATFGAPASATIENSVLQGSGGAFACALEGGAAATITSLGGNVIGDASCNPAAADLSETDALLGPLADNGGPTLTHLPDAASGAIDLVGGACPSIDQRGVPRPQGGACDSGAVEVAAI
ncbi:MAG: carbohydrate binding domain-containing protein [Ilumatobacter sp.]